MKTLLLPQPWATLAARGVAKFHARNTADPYRGTVAIVASHEVDGESSARLQSDPEFAERMAGAGFSSAADIERLPRLAIVGIAVIADMWNLESLEEVATEDDAILLGDVDAASIFIELAECVVITPLTIEPDTAPGTDAVELNDDVNDESDESVDDSHEEPPKDAFDLLADDLVPRVREAALAAGARFDADELVFWPVVPSASLAALIGDDAVGDREITRRIWQYITEQDLQDPEDHSYVYFDEALRAALETDVEGLSAVEFSERIATHVHRPTAT